MSTLFKGGARGNQWQGLLTHRGEERVGGLEWNGKELGRLARVSAGERCKSDVKR